MRQTLVVPAVIAVLLSGAPAGAATTIGATGTPVVCNPSRPGTDGVPAAVLLGQGATSIYTASAPGVITSFSTLANNVDGQVQAIVFGAGATSTQRTVVAKSAKVAVTKSMLNTFQVRLSIGAGQQLGLGFTAPNMGCAIGGAAGDVTFIQTDFDPDASSTFVPNGTLSPGTPRPNISAVLEPDVDGDGFGDVSQDACPQSGLTQVACPAPNTDLTKRPAKVRANPKVKVKFTSDIAGSTFECQVDGRAFKPCTSPFKRKMKLGTHKLKFRAISPFGIVEAKAAKVKVEIVRAR